ncbi:MAG TPA: O-antigen ligase domain-containing protein [candidate division WWE3 bacterium]|uniref:O-antigen ligase domain-containing protein n=1 Tax=candidate division WWE3 bacterium TaxID=2053526 RepID=A0A7C1SNR4_UNCKA|nr:O-antigen ligase domain-containing protein [candidate division WWE3 bacterium]
MRFPTVIQKKKQVFHTIKEKIFWTKKEFSTNPRGLLILLIFYTILVLFPTNLAKYFPSSQSYVLGILIGFLEPAFYLLEFLVFLLLVFSDWKKIKNKGFLALLVLFLATLVPSIFTGSFTEISGFRFMEIALWLGFGFWVAENISWQKKDLVFKALGIGVFWVSILSLFQFILQRNVFGYWFLGEPILSPSLPNVATIGLFGREFMRSYGTFPHPNVLGGVLSIILVWFLASKLWKASLAGAVGALVSFSRTGLVSLVGGILGLFAAKGLGLVLFNYPSFINSYSVSRRVELLEKAWEMFKPAPFTGVGLGNFTKALPDFGVPADITLTIQPVHNIFALVAAESGIFAFLAFLSIFAFSLYKTLAAKRFLLTISLLQLVFLGFFDHYLYTLPQGLFILSLTLGLSFSYSDTDGR